MTENYPTSIDSYSTKVDNVTDVLADHVNTLQVGVLALQTTVGITSSADTNSLDYILRTHVASTANPHSVTKAQVGLGNVEDTDLSTWAGSTNLTTLGTIVTGVWNGTAIGWTYVDKTGSDLADLDTKSHTSLTDIGTNTHAQIDTHISNTSNPHSVTLEQARTANNTLSGNINANSYKITNLATPSSGTDSVNKDYVDNLIQGLEWQDSVDSFVNFVTSEPAGPTTGDRYINTTTGTSSGTSQSVTEDYIYEWNGSTWTEIVPNEGFALWVDDLDRVYLYNGSSWIVFGGIVNHNALSGLQGGTTDEYYHLTSAQHTDLTDAGDSALHYHSTDRARANHTGTQTASTISDFDTEVSNNTDVAANTVHRTSDGTDHTYIDQDYRITALPEWAGVALTDSLSNPSYKEGLMFYDDTKKSISYFNDESDVTVNLGQEVLIKVYNDSGATITKGSVVYPTGVDAGTDLATIGLADASEKDKCRLIGMATHDIENNSVGYVTRIGDVGGLNTTGLSGVLYLSATTPGAYTMTQPDDGAFVTTVGAVGKVDGSEGTIVVDPVISHITVEVTDTNGFPSDQRTGTTISFVDGTRTFTIAPTGSDFHYYILGDKYEKTSSEDVVITDVSGCHLIYYDGSTLTSLATPTDAQFDEIIRTKCLVAIVYWNATDSLHQILNDERHGISMSPETHSYLHFTRGSQYLSGLAIGDIVIGNGSLDSHAQFSNSSGFVTDEDLLTSIDAVASTTGLTYLYRSGSSGYWTSATNAGFSFPVSATPLPQYNEFTGATYQLTEITSGNYMLLHIFASNDTGDKLFSIIGDTDYSTITAASIGAESEIGRILAGLPVPEFVAIASIIIEGKTAFTNSVQARIVQTTLGDDYIDWRTTELTAGTTATNHNNLAGLELAESTVTWGHIDDQAQTLAGIKTFSNFPITPSSAPTTDYQVANKKYVDDNAISSPLTTKGDLFGYSTVDARIPIGTDDYVLTADSTEALGVAWKANPAGFTDPMTTRGDIIIRNSSNVTDRLAIGTTGQVLTTDGTDISWGNAGTGTVSSVAAGNGLDFTTITTTGSVTLGTPSTLTNATTNAVTSTSHTHDITTANLTETTSSVLTITGGTDCLLGSGTTIEVDQADTSNDGYLSSTDWNTFNGKQDSLTFGIADTNAVQIDSASVADNEYARFTASGLESRSVTELRSDINVEDGADVTDATNVAASGAIMETLANAKGDIIAATANDTVTRLAVGTDTYVLTADSGEATGMKWAAAGSGSGDVVGPGSSTDEAIARFDSTTGKLLQNSQYTTISDTGTITITPNGTNKGIYVNQANAEYGIHVNSSNVGSSDPCIRTDSINQPGAYFLNPSTNTAKLADNAASLTGSNYFYRNLPSASTGGSVVFIEQDNASDDQPGIKIQQDGTAVALEIDQNTTYGDIQLTNRGAAPSSGTEGQIGYYNDSLYLRTSSSWVTVAGTGLVDPMTTRGDIIIRNSSNVTDRLAVGTNGQVLTTDGTDVSWGSAGTGTVTSVSAGDGLDFTTITATGSVTMGTPGSITDSSTNAVTATSHTHAVDEASLTQKGIIEVATQAEVDTGTDTLRSVSPDTFENASKWDDKADDELTLNDQTGTTYTLVAGDQSKLVTLSNASDITMTVPPNSSVAFPTGTQILLYNKGAGQVTVAQGSGVTVNTSATLLLRAQYSMATLIKIATDTWILSGDLEAA